MIGTATFPHTLVGVDYHDGIATLTIRRPRALNSISPAVIHQLQGALDQATADVKVRGIVLAGEGKAFGAGADIGFFLRNVERRDFGRIVKFTETGHRLTGAIDTCPKPVVARVHGVALGAGVELALACDCIVASPRASFGFPETGLGVYPGLGGTQRTPRAIGVPLAKWLILTGSTISAATARAIGLVHHVVPPAALAAAADRCARGLLPVASSPAMPPQLGVLAKLFSTHCVDDFFAGTIDPRGDAHVIRVMKQIVTKAPIALRYAERFINLGIEQPLACGLQLEIDHIAEIFSTRDACRGLTFCANRQVGLPDFEAR